MKKEIIKSYDIEKSEDGERKFSGWLSKYGNIDRDNDIIVKGAFKDAINKRSEYPLMYNHNTKDLEYTIGTFTAYEKNEGVWIEAELFEKGMNKNADMIYELLKKGGLQEMSIGFGIEDPENDVEIVNNKSRGYGYDFKKAFIREGSVVVTPANPEATIENVKSLKEKESEKKEADKKELNEKRKQAIERLNKKIKLAKYKGE